MATKRASKQTTPVLTQWTAQPASCPMVLLYRPAFSLPPNRGLSEFFQKWLQGGGNTELKGSLAGADLALALREQPSALILQWCGERPEEWRLFYSQKVRNPEVDGLLFGPYLPWGYSAELDASLHHSDLLIDMDGTVTALPASDNFANVLEMFGRKASLNAPAKPKPVQATEMPQLIYPLRLQNKQALFPPSNIVSDLERVAQRIAGLEQQRISLEWWYAQTADHIRVWVYREEIGPSFGTVWQLGDWLREASDPLIDQLVHTRVEVEAFGALHLLKQDKEDRPSAPNLPTPWRELEIEGAWKRRGRQVLVDPGQCVWPPPPPSSPHVVDLMEKALWEEIDRSQPLVLMRDQDLGQVWRFATPSFRSLREQLPLLNVHAAQLRQSGSMGNAKPVDRILEHLHADLNAALEEYKTKVRGLLDRTWFGDRADLDRHRKRVAEALAEADKIRARRQELEDFRGKDRSSWNDFVEEVLKLDRASRASSVIAAEWLAHVDQIRRAVGVLAELPTTDRAEWLRRWTEDVNAIAGQLSTLTGLLKQRR